MTCEPGDLPSIVVTRGSVGRGAPRRSKTVAERRSASDSHRPFAVTAHVAASFCSCSPIAYLVPTRAF